MLRPLHNTNRSVWENTVVLANSIRFIYIAEEFTRVMKHSPPFLTIITIVEGFCECLHSVLQLDPFRAKARGMVLSQEPIDNNSCIVITGFTNVDEDMMR